MKKGLLFGVLLCIIMSTLLSTGVFATGETAKEMPEVNWVEGPTTSTLGDLAVLNVEDSLLYLNKEDTVKIMEFCGNPESQKELGSVYPKDESKNWFIVFEYYDIGHVKDEDKDNINADELLKSIKEGTEEQNKERREKKIPELKVLDWLEKPYYDESLHSLVWATLSESEGEKTVNYEAEILCREGYVAATLVCSQEELEEAKPYVKKVVDNFSFVEGKRYTDYVPGKDKLSEMGLAALIGGGAAAVAKKGFLLLLVKKFWFLIFAPIAAIFAKFRKKKTTSNDVYSDNTSNFDNNDDSRSM